MNTLDIHLKFPDETTAIRLMLETGLLQQFIDGEGKTFNAQGQGQMIDVIGLIYKPTGTSSEMVDVGGWHVNMRGELPETIKPYRITVTGTPHRIWD